MKENYIVGLFCITEENRNSSLKISNNLKIYQKNPHEKTFISLDTGFQSLKI